jgi:hypothetical protein
MRPIKAQTTNGPTVFNIASIYLATAFGRIKTYFSAMRSGSGSGGINVMTRYGGRSWCDSSERELIDDIANYRLRRF